MTAAAFSILYSLHNAVPLVIVKKSRLYSRAPRIPRTEGLGALSPIFLMGAQSSDCCPSTHLMQLCDFHLVN